jgi:hypothetical protein
MASSSLPSCSRALALRFSAFVLGGISESPEYMGEAGTHYILSSLMASSQSDTTLFHSLGSKLE